MAFDPGGSSLAEFITRVGAPTLAAVTGARRHEFNAVVEPRRQDPGVLTALHLP
ncbi:MAG: hypothetical protein ACXWLY_10255 [Thermoanaerobaculia bacterium]